MLEHHKVSYKVVLTADYIFFLNTCLHNFFYNIKYILLGMLNIDEIEHLNEN